MIPMPYISKPKQERQKWITLKEAILNICNFDQCDEVVALHDLRLALADRTVGYRFEAGGWFYSLELFDGQQNRTRERHFWRSIPIDLKSGAMKREDFDFYFSDVKALTLFYDELLIVDMFFSGVGPDLWCPSINIFVFKDDVIKIWGNKNPRSHDPLEGVQRREDPEEGPKHSKIPGKVHGPASEAAVRRALLEIYDEADDAGTRPPNENEALRQVKKRIAPKTTSRKTVRPILKEFENRRWDRGQHSPKKK
jgi:hypothetical protein